MTAPQTASQTLTEEELSKSLKVEIFEGVTALKLGGVTKDTHTIKGFCDHQRQTNRIPLHGDNLAEILENTCTHWENLENSVDEHWAKFFISDDSVFTVGYCHAIVTGWVYETDKDGNITRNMVPVTITITATHRDAPREDD